MQLRKISIHSVLSFTHICEQLEGQGGPRAAIQLTRGTLYPLNCPDQERIKSANVHHSILANGLNEWERINAPLLLWRCSKNSQVNIVHSRYIISSFAQLPIHEQIEAILVLLKTRHKRKGRDM